MKTKGALIWEFNQPWSIEEIEIGDPVKDEVKIQMEASGMCHSDHHLVTGGIPMGGFPVLGGHEGAGIVTEVGPGVEDLAPGDHVVLSFIPSCGAVSVVSGRACATCATWAPACSAGPRCPTAPSASRPRGKHVFPMTLLGTFCAVHGRAQELGGEDRSVHPVRGGRLVGCGVTTGYGSAVRSGRHPARRRRR